MIGGVDSHNAPMKMVRICAASSSHQLNTHGYEEHGKTKINQKKNHDPRDEGKESLS